MNSRELTDDRLGELAAYGSRAIPVGQKDRTISELARELAAAREALAQAEQRERALREALERIADPIVWFRDHCVPEGHRWNATDTMRMYDSGRWHERFAAETLAAVAPQPGDGQREAGGGTER